MLARFETSRIRIQRCQRVDDLSEVLTRAAIDDVEIVDLLSQAMSFRGDASADKEFDVSIDQHFQELAGELFVFRKRDIHQQTTHQLLKTIRAETCRVAKLTEYRPRDTQTDKAHKANHEIRETHEK